MPRQQKSCAQYHSWEGGNETLLIEEEKITFFLSLSLALKINLCVPRALITSMQTTSVDITNLIASFSLRVSP